MDERRRRQYLAAMDISVWTPRADAETKPEPDCAQATQPGSPAGRRPTAPAPSHPQPPEPPAWLDEPPPWADDEPARPDQQERLQAASPTAARRGDDLPAPEADASVDIASMDWPALESEVATCRRCGLCETRTNTVFGVGDRQASLMLIGEGPGQDEDRQGEPFVGRAGQLLNKMLAAVDLEREHVYIANVVKCRPPGNRNPAADEASACGAFLRRQIALVEPKLLVSLGGVSANSLLGGNESVGRLRNRRHDYRPTPGAESIPLLVTYHPSYYLRSPAEKAKGWKDLQQIVHTLQQLA